MNNIVLISFTDAFCPEHISNTDWVYYDFANSIYNNDQEGLISGRVTFERPVVITFTKMTVHFGPGSFIIVNDFFYDTKPTLKWPFTFEKTTQIRVAVPFGQEDKPIPSQLTLTLPMLVMTMPPLIQHIPQPQSQHLPTGLHGDHVLQIVVLVLFEAEHERAILNIVLV